MFIVRYIFHDYIFVIEKSSIHTCHRDSNCELFNKINHPSYTFIIYLEDMNKCLGIIPTSHKNKHNFGFNLTNKIKQVQCKKGDILLFNSCIIHAGLLDKKSNYLRIQMKYSHKDDIPLLNYYTNYNKLLNKKNNLPYSIKKIQQNLSCMIPLVADSSIESMKKNKNIKNIIDIPLDEQIFNYIFYGRSDYYNLDNAF